MPPTSLAARLQRRGFHYGWVVAAVTLCTMLTMPAALGLPGAMIQPLGREFGWSTDQVSSALALFGLMGPFAAVLMERFGLRAVICTALAMVAGLAFFLMRNRPADVGLRPFGEAADAPQAPAAVFLIRRPARPGAAAAVSSAGRT